MLDKSIIQSSANILFFNPVVGNSFNHRTKFVLRCKSLFQYIKPITFIAEEFLCKERHDYNCENTLQDCNIGLNLAFVDLHGQHCKHNNLFVGWHVKKFFLLASLTPKSLIWLILKLHQNCPFASKFSYPQKKHLNCN